MNRTTLALLVVPFVLSACRSKQKVCEHARDRLDEVHAVETKYALAEMSPPYHATVEKRAARYVELVRGLFVEPCTKLEGEAFECMRNIDTYVDAYVPATEAVMACPSAPADSVDFSPCEEEALAARAAIRDEHRACVDAIEAIIDDGLPPNWDAGLEFPPLPQTSLTTPEELGHP